MNFPLVVVSLVIVMWLVGAGPAYLLAGSKGLAGSGLAAVLCLVSTLLCYVVRRWAVGRGPGWELGAFLGGMLFRMALVLGVVAFVYGRGIFDLSSFVLWVIIFYLVLLGVETYHVHALMQKHKR